VASLQTETSVSAMTATAATAASSALVMARTFMGWFVGVYVQGPERFPVSATPENWEVERAGGQSLRAESQRRHAQLQLPRHEKGLLLL
jgi:hypothetical protein